MNKRTVVGEVGAKNGVPRREFLEWRLRVKERRRDKGIKIPG